MDLYHTITNALTPPAPLLPEPPAWHALAVSLQRWGLAYEYGTVVRQYYPTATRITIILSSEYNDEGGYYALISEILVYDQSGQDITHTIDDDEQWDEYREQWSDLSTPSDLGYTIPLDLTAPLLAPSITREQVLAKLQLLQVAFQQLPDACFAPASIEDDTIPWSVEKAHGT